MKIYSAVLKCGRYWWMPTRKGLSRSYSTLLGALALFLFAPSIAAAQEFPVIYADGDWAPGVSAPWVLSVLRFNIPGAEVVISSDISATRHAASRTNLLARPAEAVWLSQGKSEAVWNTLAKPNLNTYRPMSAGQAALVTVGGLGIGLCAATPCAGWLATAAASPTGQAIFASVSTASMAVTVTQAVDAGVDTPRGQHLMARAIVDGLPVGGATRGFAGLAAHVGGNAAAVRAVALRSAESLSPNVSGFIPANQVSDLPLRSWFDGAGFTTQPQSISLANQRLLASADQRPGLPDLRGRTLIAHGGVVRGRDVNGELWVPTFTVPSGTHLEFPVPLGEKILSKEIVMIMSGQRLHSPVPWIERRGFSPGMQVPDARLEPLRPEDSRFVQGFVQLGYAESVTQPMWLSEWVDSNMGYCQIVACRGVGPLPEEFATPLGLGIAPAEIY